MKIKFNEQIIDEHNIGWQKDFKAKIVEGIGEGKVCTLKEAYDLAKENGLDLVLIKPGSKDGELSIVKILNYSKYVYDLKKKEKENKKKQRQSIQKMKEVKFHVGIDGGDFLYKVNHIKEFVEDGDKVNCQIILRGREAYNNNVIDDFLAKLKNSISEFGEMQNDFIRQGKLISCFIVKKK